MSTSTGRQHSGTSTHSSTSTQQQFALNRPPYPNDIQFQHGLNNNPFIQPQQRSNQLNIPNNILFRGDTTLNTSDDDITSTINSPMPTQYSTATYTPNNIDITSPNVTVTSGKRMRGRSMNEPMIDDSPELNGTGPYNSLKLRRKLRKNTREKQRRTELNDQFDILCDMLHLNTGHNKVEKFTVLTEAIDTIKRLNAQLVQMKNERYELRNELSKLTTVLQQSNNPSTQHDIQALQQIQQRYFPPSPHTDQSRTTSQSTTPHTQYTSYTSQQPSVQPAYNNTMYPQQSQIPLQINTVMPDSFATMSVSTPTRNVTPVQSIQTNIEPTSPAYTYNSAPATVSPNHQAQRVSPHSALYQQSTPTQSVMPSHHRTLSRSSTDQYTQSTTQHQHITTRQSSAQQYPPVPTNNSITFPQYNRPSSAQPDINTRKQSANDITTKMESNSNTGNTAKLFDTTNPQYQSQFSPSQLTMVSPTSNTRMFNFTQPNTSNATANQPVFQYSRHRRGTGSFGSGFAFGSGSFNFNFTNNNLNNVFPPVPVSNTPVLDTLPTLDELTNTEQENNTNNIETTNTTASKPIPTHQRRPSFNTYSHNRNLSLGLFGTHQRLPSLGAMITDSIVSPPFASTPLIPAVQEEDIDV